MNVLISWFVGKVKDYALNNYRTTLAGVLGALVLQYPPLAPFKEPIMAAVIALIGLLAKDGDTTGTVAQPRTAPEIVKMQNEALKEVDSAVDPSVAVSGG